MYDTPNGFQSEIGQSQVQLLSVTSLNRLAKSLLESNFPAVLVEGEISNLARPTSGHWYLTLKDKSSQIRCAMFANRNRGLPFKPANGMQVTVRGRLSIYEGRGDYQLIVDRMEEAGAGALRRAFELLKAKLNDEGLFRDDKKQQVADRYRHIGVITSATGAAFQDILTVLARRFPATQITLLPVLVQGLEAPAEIVAAIETANKLKDKLGLEVLIVGRGGGSLEDLQAFNEESVARAIFASALPVVSAVGHEIDFTIADFVADLRAPTPSAAAELLSPDKEEYGQLFLRFEQKLFSCLKQRLQQARQQIDWLGKRMKHPGRHLQEQAQTLDVLEGRLRRAYSHRLTHSGNQVQRLAALLKTYSPQTRIRQYNLAHAATTERLYRSIKQQLLQKSDQIRQLSRNLNAVSPLNTLARGYSITYTDKLKVLRSSDDVKPGSKLISHLAEGRVFSTVDTTDKD